MGASMVELEMLRKPVSSFSPLGGWWEEWRCFGIVRGEVWGPPLVEGWSLSRDIRCEVGGAATTLLGGFSGPSLLPMATIPELEESKGVRFCGRGVAYGLPVLCTPGGCPLRFRMRCFAVPVEPVNG